MNKFTIITPSYRANNLLEIRISIHFESVDEWIIVYDGNKIESNPHVFQEKVTKLKNMYIKEKVYQVILNEIRSG